LNYCRTHTLFAGRPGRARAPATLARLVDEPKTRWLTSPHHELEKTGDAASESLEIEAYSIQITEELGSVMNRQNTPPLSATVFDAIANMAPRDEVPAQMSFPWYASAMLAFESFEVIRLRLEKLLIGGDAADHEARLMVSEKVDAMFEAGASLMTGATPASIIGRYREHVAANTKRLSAI
jgi:hypothetical protein